MPDLEITEVVLVHCNIVNGCYEQNSRALYTFSVHKSFVLLFDLSPKNFIFLKNFNLEFYYIEVWFTGENSKPLELEDKTKTSL